MMACGSLAREVPKRNLRSFSLVSGEKEYRRDSDCRQDFRLAGGSSRRARDAGQGLLTMLGGGDVVRTRGRNRTVEALRAREKKSAPDGASGDESSWLAMFRSKQAGVLRVFGPVG